MSAESRSGMVLAEAGRPCMNIVVSPSADSTTGYAAEELRRHLHEMVGASPQLRRNCQGPAVYVGHAEAARTAGIDMEGLGPEAFRTEGRDGNLYVLGGSARGVLYGIYDLLESLGCRWFTPEVRHIPRLPKVVVPALPRRGGPAFEFRDTFCWEAGDPTWWARNRLNGWYTPLPDYMGGSVGYGLFVHTFYTLVPPGEFFASHPEYFSLIEGQRRHEMGQLCLSNPDVLRLVVERVLEKMRALPKARIFSVSQNDWAGYCQCPACTAIAEAEGSQAGPMLNFVNAVAEKTSEVFPDKLIDTLAYQYTLDAPKLTAPHANVRVRLCSIRCCQGHGYGTCDHPESGRFLRALEAWGRLTKQMYIWHYCTNFAHYPLPMPDFDELHANISLYKRFGVHGVFMQGMGANGGGAESMALRGYVIAKLLWNPAAPVWPIVDEFLHGVYGKAAGGVRQYLELFHARVRRDRSIHPSLYDPPTHALFDSEVLAQAEAVLAAGEGGVRGAERERVRLLRGGVQYARLARCCGVFRREGDEFRGDATDADRHEFAALIKTWKRAGVERLREGRSLAQSITMLRNRLTPHRVAWLRRDGLVIGVVGDLGGRILEWEAHGRQWLAPPDPENKWLLYPMSGGYSEFVVLGAYGFRAWGEPYKCHVAGGKVTVRCDLEGGLGLSRTYSLDGSVLRIVSRLRNRSSEAVEASWGASLHLSVPDLWTLRFGTKGGEIAWTPADIPDGQENQTILEGDRRPDGAWRVDVPGWTLRHRYGECPVDRAVVSRQEATGLLALDLRTETMALASGAQIVMRQEMEIARA